jgi:hypothetical protein
MSSYPINPTRVPEPLYADDICGDDVTWPAEDLHWYPKVKKWLCPICSADPEGLGRCGVRLDKWLAGSDDSGKVADAQRTE